MDPIHIIYGSHLTTTAGPRARWHEVLFRFDLRVQYIPGNENVVADCMSWWAYPASTAFADATLHGSARDEDEMVAIMEEERRMKRAR